MSVIFTCKVSFVSPFDKRMRFFAKDHLQIQVYGCKNLMIALGLHGMKF